MLRISKNVDLFRSLGDGWEPCTASAGDVVFYTANYTAGYSADGGATFTPVSPFGLANAFGLNFCCDQVVQYIPQIDRFAWISQTNPDSKNENSYLLAVASPAQILATQGRAWKVYNLSSAKFWKRPGQWVDFPELAVGDHYLYLTFNVVGAVSLIARFPLTDLANDVISSAQFVATNNFWVRPVQNTGDRGYFGALNNYSQLRVFSWGEGANDLPVPHDVDIASIPTEITESRMPNGTDWFQTVTKYRLGLYGATRSGDQLWFAWNGARRVAGQAINTFPHPHIGIAIIGITSFSVEERFLWSSDYAYAYPALATNAEGEVGISFASGGGSVYPQPGVGILTGRQELVPITNGKTAGGGGHFLSIRGANPPGNLFSAAGYQAPLDPTTSAGYTNHPHYVLFGRDPCESLSDEVDQLAKQIADLEEALAGGEIPITPASVPKLKALLKQLKRKLPGRVRLLQQCQARNP